MIIVFVKTQQIFEIDEYINKTFVREEKQTTIRCPLKKTYQNTFEKLINTKYEPRYRIIGFITS